MFFHGAKSTKLFLLRGSLCLTRLVISNTLYCCGYTACGASLDMEGVQSAFQYYAKYNNVDKSQCQHNRLCQARLALQPPKSSQMQGVGLGATWQSLCSAPQAVLFPHVSTTCITQQAEQRGSECCISALGRALQTWGLSSPPTCADFMGTQHKI